LQFEEEVVGDTMWGVPAVSDGGLLVLSVGEFLAQQSVVFDVVDGFQVEDGEDCFEDEEDGGLHVVEMVDCEDEADGRDDAEHGIVQEEGFVVVVLLHAVDILYLLQQCAWEEGVDALSLSCEGGIFGGSISTVVSKEMFVCGVHVQILGHV
jgi:hypothetical protein